VGATELTVPNTDIFFYDLLLDLPFLNVGPPVTRSTARNIVICKLRR
jgi:hypothetical protein